MFYLILRNSMYHTYTYVTYFLKPSSIFGHAVIRTIMHSVRRTYIYSSTHTSRVSSVRHYPQHLYLSSNRLRSLPGSLAVWMPSLVYLDVRNNLLESVPPGLAQLSRLQVLLLQDNRISVLPPQLGETVYLPVRAVRHATMLPCTGPV